MVFVVMISPFLPTVDPAPLVEPVPYPLQVRGEKDGIRMENYVWTITI